jgi:hypothetical protein
MGRHARTCDSDLANAIRLLPQGGTLRVFGRCHACEGAPKAGRRIVVEVSRVWPAREGQYSLEPQDRLPETFDLARYPHGWYGTAAALTEGDVKCPHCGSGVYEWKGVRATYVSDAACSADCEKATGEHCRCSCGGANHGMRAI